MSAILIVDAPTAITPIQASIGGDTMSNDGRTLVAVKNGTVATVRMHVVQHGACSLVDDHGKPDFTIDFPASATAYVYTKVFDTFFYSNPATGLLDISWTDTNDAPLGSTTNLIVAGLRVL